MPRFSFSRLLASSRRPVSPGRAVAILASTVASLLPLAALGAGVTKYWDGGGNNNFYNPPNWNGDTRPAYLGTIANGSYDVDSDALVFNGPTPAATINLNIGTATDASYTVKSFTFNDTGSAASFTYTFNGPQTLVLGDNRTSNPLDTGFITNNSTGTQTFNLNGNASSLLPYEIGFNFGGINAAAGQLVFGPNANIDIGNQSNAAGRSIVVTGASNTTIGGQLVGLGTDVSAGGTVTKTGAGTLFLNGDSTAWDGRIVVTEGAVQISKASSLGTSAGRTTISGGTADGRVEIVGGINVAENFHLEGRTDGTKPHLVNVSGNNSLTGTISLDAGGTEYGISSTAGALTVLGNIVRGTAAGVLNIHLGGGGNGLINGDLGAGFSIIKQGTGTWKLAGANTYDGPTTVEAGRLEIATSGTGGGGGAVTIGDGGTLALTLSATGQTLQTSTLTLGTTTGGVLAFDLGAFSNTAAPVVTAGNLAINGTGNVITLKATGLTVGQQITLIDYTSGSAANLSLGTLPARIQASLTDDTVNTRVVLTINAFDIPRWTGKYSSNWDLDADGTGATGTANWKEINSGNETRYLQGTGGIDSVRFDDLADVGANPLATTVNLTAALTPGAVTVDNSALNYTFTGFGKLSGALTLLKTGTGTLILANGDSSIVGGLNDYTGLTTINGGTIQLGDGVTTGVGQFGSGSVAIGSGATLAVNRPDDLTLANDLSGAGLLRKLGGNSTLTLTGNNLGFAGTVAVDTGTLKLGSASALGTATAVTVSSGATLDLSGRLLGSGQTVTISGIGANGVGALINSGTGGVTVGVRQLVLAGDTTIGGTGRFDIRDVDGTGGFNAQGKTLTKIGANTVFLADLGETHLGSLIINGGRISLAGDTTAGDQPGVIQINGGTLGFETSTAVLGKNIEFNGGIIIAVSGTANQVSGNISLLDLDPFTASPVVNTFQTTTALTVSGNIGGLGTLTKTGPGTLFLSGTNSYAGGTVISAGTIVFNSAAAIPAAGGISSVAGTTIGFGFAFDQSTLSTYLPAATNAANIALLADNANNLDLTAYGATASLGAVGNATYSGNLTPIGGSYLFGGGGGTLTVSSILSGTNSVTIGGGSGTVVLTAANTLTGGTIVNAGSTLRLGNAAALGAATSALTSAGTVDLNGFNLTVGSLTSSANTALITDNSVTAGTTVLTVNIASGVSSTYQGSIINGANGRVISLIKDGAGTLILNKANGSTYTGDTILRAGKLDVRVNQSQVLPIGTRIVFEGSAIFSAANNGAAAGQQTLAGVAFNSGEGIFENFRQNANAISSTITLNSLPTRAAGATGNFTLNGTTDAVLYKVVLPAGTTPGQSLNGGIYFNGTGFAAYDPAGYLRALDYTLDPLTANVALTNGDQSTLGSVTDKDVQLGGTSGGIIAQTTDRLRTLRLNDATSVNLNSDATLEVTTGGILKAGGNAASITGGAGLFTQGGGDLVVRTVAAADSLTIAAPLTAATTGGLTKVGAGTLVLSGANAFTGGVWVNGGTLYFAVQTALPSTGTVRLAGGATVGFGWAFNQTFLTNRLSVTTTASVIALGANNSNNLNFNSLGYTGISLGAIGDVTYTGTLTPASNVYRLGGGGGTLTFGQQITNNTGNGIARSIVIGNGGAAGTVYLTGANSQTGAVTISGGVLKIGNALALGNGNVAVNAGTLDLNGYTLSLRNLTGNAATGTITDSSAGPGTTVVTANILSGANTFGGSIVDGANGRQLSLVKDGTGTLALNKANGSTYTGDTIIRNGKLDVRTHIASVISSASHLVFEGNGIFSAANNGSVDGALTLAGLNFNSGAGTIEHNNVSGTALSNTLTFQGGPNRAAGATGNFTLLNATDPAVFKTVFTTAPVTNQAIDGGLFFSGKDFAAYDSAGYVRALSYTGLDTNAANVALSVDQATLGDVSGKDVQLTGASISAQTDLSLHTLKVSGASNVTLAAAQTLTLSGGGLLKADGGVTTITGGAGLTTGNNHDLVIRTDAATDTVVVATSILASSTGGLTKDGAGTLQLTASNDFTGGVWVDGGTLEVTATGSINHAGTVTATGGTLVVRGSLQGVTNAEIRSGATLTGAGTIQGVAEGGHVAVKSGGSLAPGLNGAGTLSLDLGLAGQLDLSAAAGGTGYLKFELGSTSDQVKLLTGQLNLGTGGLDLDDFSFTNSGGLGEGTYVLFDTNQAIVGTFGSTLTGNFNGFDYNLALGDGGQDLVLVVSVPEPGALMSLVGGAGMLLLLRRRRKS